MSQYDSDSKNVILGLLYSILGDSDCVRIFVDNYRIIYRLAGVEKHDES